jgi:4-hydroxy-2-oxoheptanedioate aldolase
MNDETAYTTALSARWADGQTALGIWTSSGSASVARLVDFVGFDFVAWDCQHSPLDEAGAAELLRSARPSKAGVVVRVSKLDDALIGKVADAGADGVIIPLVSTPEEAALAVAACRYPPHGRRSFGPMRPEMRGLSLKQLAARIACFILAETREALRNIDAICQVDGLDGVFVGPKDLSISLSQEDPQQLRHAIHDLKAACDRHGIKFGVAASSAAEAAYWSSQGAHLVTVGSDVVVFQRALSDELRQARAVPGGVTVASA